MLWKFGISNEDIHHTHIVCCRKVRLKNTPESRALHRQDVLLVVISKGSMCEKLNVTRNRYQDISILSNKNS